MDMLIKKNFDLYRSPVGINWFILVTITLFLICLGIQEAYCAEKDIQETLYARIRINVTWNVDKGTAVNKGSLDMNLNGMLIYNKEMSSPTHGLPSVMLTYDPQNMTGFYRYREEIISTKDTECPLLEEYHGSGSFSFREPSKLMVHYLGGLFKDIPLKKTGHSETAGYLIDYYDFGIHPPQLTAEGKRRYSSKCSYKPFTRRFNSSLKIRFRMKTNGEMSGHRTWTSRMSTGRPTFTIGMSDLGEPYKEKPYRPPAEDPGNVTYRVEWRIDKAPAIDIFRETEPDVFTPITNASQEVIVGEKIKLKAVVLPYDESSKGVWEIPESVISGFVADRNRGKVIPLEKEQKRKPVIEFFFTDGEFSKGKPFEITYTTEDKKLQGKTTFKVFEPEVKTNEKTPSKEITVGPFGNSNCRLYLGKLKVINPPEGKPGMLISHEVKMPTQFSSQPHLLWYVQRIKEEVLEYHDADYFQKVNEEWCLDTHYPYGKMIPAPYKVTMNDSPGVDLGLATKEVHVQDQFETYLMFIPSGSPEDKNCVWVPLKVVEWGWGAAVKRTVDWDENPPCDDKTFTFLPGYYTKPREKDCEKHPEWSCNVEKNARNKINEDTWEKSKAAIRNVESKQK
jgi:hypothetical protein